MIMACEGKCLVDISDIAFIFSRLGGGGGGGGERIENKGCWRSEEVVGRGHREVVCEGGGSKIVWVLKFPPREGAEEKCARTFCAQTF